VAPVALLPAWARAAAEILPFRWMIGFPVELLLGGLTPAQALAGFAAQVIWILLGLGLVRLVWRAGVRSYSAVGA
jgi:ABC-2 type transport system permease protein